MGALSGIRIAVTRPIEQAGSFIENLRQGGAEIIASPVISIFPCFDPKNFKELLSRIREFEWVCFTSANGVKLAFEFARSADAMEGLVSRKFACIGPATAAELSKWGCRAEIIPSAYQAEGLIEAFSKLDLKNRKMLLLQAKGARRILNDGLVSQGAEVVDFPPYESIPDQDGLRLLQEKVARRQVDCITFASGSAVEAFDEMMKSTGLKRELSADLKLASIGPVTSDALRRRSLRVDIEAHDSTAAGLLKALSAYYETRLV